MGAPLRLTERDGTITFDVRVKPRSSRDAIVGVRDARIEIAVRASPVEGEANEALVRLLASTLDVPKRNVELVRGHRGRKKTVRVTGVTRQAVESLVRE